MDIFKDRILPLINNSGKTDRFLEEAIELPRGIIYKWKNGKNKNYKFYIVEIAAYFKVSTDYLIGKTDDPSPPGAEEKPPHRAGGLSEKERIVLEKLSRLTPENVDKAQEYLDLLLVGQEKKETS